MCSTVSYLTYIKFLLLIPKLICLYQLLMPTSWLFTEWQQTLCIRDQSCSNPFVFLVLGLVFTVCSLPGWPTFIKWPSAAIVAGTVQAEAPTSADHQFQQTSPTLPPCDPLISRASSLSSFSFLPLLVVPPFDYLCQTAICCSLLLEGITSVSSM